MRQIISIVTCCISHLVPIFCITYDMSPIMSQTVSGEELPSWEGVSEPSL